MVECGDCGKRIGTFASSSDCMEEGCEVVFCSDCEDKHTCEKCDSAYCVKHMKGHACESEEAEDETMEDEGNTYQVQITYKVEGQEDGESTSEKTFSNMTLKRAKELFAQITTQLNAGSDCVSIELPETKDETYTALLITSAKTRIISVDVDSE